MKWNSIKILCLLFIIALASCKSGDKMPPTIKTAQDARVLLPGKTWVVKDVGLKPYEFSSEPNPNSPLVIDWFSVAKELGEYETKAKESFGKASIELKQDSVASTTGLELTGNQKYFITDEAKDNTPPGVRLEITGGSDAFKDMGFTEATFTYIVLGANEKTLLLQTPNEINRRKIVLLLEAK